MSEFITRSSTNRVRFNDKKHLFSNPRKQIYSVLIIFLVILFSLIFFYLINKPTLNKKTDFEVNQLSIDSPTPTLTPGIKSPSNIFQAARNSSQIQILDNNLNLLFKLYDNSLENIPEKWLNDSVFIYKNNQYFGFIIYNKDQFSADPKLISDYSCASYLISPDSKKVIFFGNKNNLFCQGTLVDFSNLEKIKIENILNTKNTSLENAFWDSDSLSLNLVVRDEKNQTTAKIIHLK